MIEILPEYIANQIAAGEVIQRPSSVVKELLENSIDANATHITLSLKESGKKIIQVSDNGEGMSKDDSLKCFKKHATSKISNIDDLFKIKSKGFRGEALSSIASISMINLKTKKKNFDTGNEILIEGSKLISNKECSSNTGSTFIVKNLFYNVPARRNFLKSDKIEYKHILEEFIRIAISNSNVKLKLIHNGKEIYNLPIQNLKARLIKLYGNKISDKLLPINESTNLVNISGFICKPQYSKKTRGEQYFFVNDRFIKSPYLNHSVLKSMEGLILKDHFPSYFIFLEIDPKNIDINIHPTKTEIKFNDEKLIYSILKSCIKHSLGQFNIIPSIDFDVNTNFKIPNFDPNKKAYPPKIKVDPTFNPFEKNENKNNSFWKSVFNENIDEIKDLKNYDNFENNNDNFFQYLNKYIVTNNNEGILVINQRRAHEYILYNDYKNKISNISNNTQTLLHYIKIDISDQDRIIVTENIEKFNQLGFEISLKNKSMTIKAKPLFLNNEDTEELIYSIIENFKLNLTIENPIEDFFCSKLAKKNSIKNGKKLNSIEIKKLINDLHIKSKDLSFYKGDIFSFMLKFEDIKKNIG